MMLRRHPRLRRSIDHFSFDELLRLSKCEFAGISGAKGREDLASLAKLTALRLLQLWNTKVSDVAPLAELTALQVLSLKGTRVSDLVPISTLTALQSLSLMGTDVTDLAPITDRRAGHGMLLSLVRVENPQPQTGRVRSSPLRHRLKICPCHLPREKRFSPLANPCRAGRISGTAGMHQLSDVPGAIHVWSP
jgi:hypothetical protein